MDSISVIFVCITEFQETVVRHLVQLQQNQSQIINILLTKKVTADIQQDDFVDFGSLPPLPAQTVDQLTVLEDFLKEENSKKLMVKTI